MRLLGEGVKRLVTTCRLGDGRGDPAEEAPVLACLHGGLLPSED